MAFLQALESRSVNFLMLEYLPDYFQNPPFLYYVEVDYNESIKTILFSIHVCDYFVYL